MISLSGNSMDSDSEPELISLITQLLSPDKPTYAHGLVNSYQFSKLIPVITQIVSLVKSMDLDSQPKPESKLMSVIAQTISLFNSMDLDSQPKPLSELISLISQNSKDTELDPELVSDLVTETLRLETEPELISLIHQIFSLVVSMNAKWKKLISLCPQAEAYMNDEKFISYEQVSQNSDKWDCLPLSWRIFRLGEEEEATHFHCTNCNGRNHEAHDKAPVEIKHSVCPQHSFLLVSLVRYQSSRTRKCYCCDENLEEVFYYCSDCDYAMNIACVEKPRVLSIDKPKWHEHKLALFPRKAFLTCNVCALDNSSSPIYMCPPCDFVVHLRCLKLPRVIRISRHLHRISLILSFDKRDWSCGVCRKKIDSDYGGYSCIKHGCLYAAHSKCATQSNVWDGEELEQVPEEIEEEEVEPFMRISDGIIQHFSHQQHHLRLDEDTGRVYNEDKQCQACVTPIYFGNFYSCMQCDFILHEACANLSRKIQHPIHPHLLTLALVERKNTSAYHMSTCRACLNYYTAGFFYECSKGEECDFKLHVQCATIAEPLVHGSHMHPLFLTSKPGERRTCCVCKASKQVFVETFNCIECEFALCFECATIPQKLRYKHDKHMVTLSYGEETSTIMNWCEACERDLKPEERFYKCDEYCCVTLHIECLIGEDLYMKPGSSFNFGGKKVFVLRNNHHMSRPICVICEKRCPYKIVLQCSGSIVCSLECFRSLSFLFFKYKKEHLH